MSTAAEKTRETLERIGAAGVSSWDESGRANMIPVKDLIALQEKLSLQEQRSGFYPLEIVEQ